MDIIKIHCIKHDMHISYITVSVPYPYPTFFLKLLYFESGLSPYPCNLAFKFKQLQYTPQIPRTTIDYGVMKDGPNTGAILPIRSSEIVGSNATQAADLHYST